MDGIQQSFTITGTKGASARVTVTENYDIAANTSSICVGVELASSTYYGYTYYLNGSIAAAGQTLQTMESFSGTHYVTVSALNTYYPVSGGDGHAGSPWSLGNIAHNTDGSKTVTVSVTVGGVEPSGKGAHGFTVTGSKEITLTHIPRASTVAATDADIGAVSMVAVSKKSSGYTHSVAYTFGDLSGYVTPAGLSDTEVRFSDASVAFRLPERFYSQIPNAKTGTCTLTCRTYAGETQIGDAQSCSFTATAPESACAPLVTGTVTDANSATAALTGNSAVLVRYMSTALCTISAVPRNSAALTQKTVNGYALADTLTFAPAQSGSYVFAATDSRGYSASATVTAGVVPYVPLTCNPVGKRDDPTSGKATLTVTGDYYNGSFGAAANSITLRYRLGSGSWVSMTPSLSGHTYSAAAAFTGLTYTESFTVTVEVSDQLSTVTKTVFIDKGIPVFDWGETDMTFHVPVHCEAGGSGFAPTGFGLGEINGQYCDDCDALVHNGWYITGTSTKNVPPDVAAEYGGSILHIAFGTNSATQIYAQHAFNQKPSLLLRKKVNGTYSQWCWVDPPMLLGIEYPTCERFQNSLVYTKMINFGPMPNGTTVGVPHGITGITQVIRCIGQDVTTGQTIPSNYGGSYTDIYGDKNAVYIYTTVDNSAAQAYAQIWYTKD